jgi:predicted nucleic-acid-binding protein
MQSVLAHKTQFFDPNSTEANTFISSNSFLEFVKGRAKEYGQQIGVEYAEGFISKKMLGIHSFDQFILQTT